MRKKSAEAKIANHLIVVIIIISKGYFIQYMTWIEDVYL